MKKKVKKLVPELRFSEFEGDWKEKILTELANVQTGPFGSQLKNEQYITGGTPVVTVEHIKDFYICNFDYPSVTNEDKARLKKYTLKPGDIVFSRVGSVDLSACVEDYQEGWLFSSRMLRVRLNKQLKSKFVSYFLQQTKARRYIIRISVGSTMPSLNTEILQSLPIIYCTLEEQEKIASFLDSVTLRITQLRRKRELLEIYKKGVMQKIFSQEIRFKQDDGKPFPDWQKKKLGDIFTRITRKNTENNTNVLTISAQYGLINQRDFFNKSVAANDLTGYCLLKRGDFAYNKSYSNGYPMGAIKRLKLYDKGVVSSLYICFSNPIEIESRFYDQYFDGGFLNHELNKIAQEGARNHGLLNMSVIEFFKDLNIDYPTIKEQEKIANFLTSIDKKIDAVSLQIEKMEEFKQGLLQKMFV